MIRLFWWRGPRGYGNFGDELSAHLCAHLLGRSVVHTDSSAAELVAIGSLLEPCFAKPRAWSDYRGHVWGTGRMVAGPCLDLSQTQVSAVRGRWTLERIRCPEKERVLLGDPGLLAHLLAPQPSKGTVLGVVPHWTEVNDPVFTSPLFSRPDVRLIDPCGPVPRIIHQVAECQYVLSSSLHGLVLADALRIPNEWLRLNRGGEEIRGLTEFKFRDYYSVFGLEDITYLQITPQDTLEQVLEKFGPYQRPGLETIQTCLLNSFPFPKNRGHTVAIGPSP